MDAIKAVEIKDKEGADLSFAICANLFCKIKRESPEIAKQIENSFGKGMLDIPGRSYSRNPAERLESMGLKLKEVPGYKVAVYGLDRLTSKQKS